MPSFPSKNLRLHRKWNHNKTKHLFLAAFWFLFLFATGISVVVAQDVTRGSQYLPGRCKP